MNLQFDHSSKPLPDKFSKYEFFVRDLLTVKMVPEQLDLVKDHIHVDSQTDSCPFAIAFFMFRAGEHQLAIDYLQKPIHEEPVQMFAKYYQQYYQVFNGCIPQDKITIFSSECDSAFRGILDMYKDALISLMIGSNFRPNNERLFWDYLMPQELETQLWFKLKLASYEIKQSQLQQQSEYLTYPKLESY